MEKIVKKVQIKRAQKVVKEVEKTEKAKACEEARKKLNATVITMQDIISCNIEEVQKLLKGYEKIEEAEYKFMKPDTVIRYLRKIGDDKYKLVKGGKLMTNNYPDYFMLKPVHNYRGGTNKPWSVQLKDGNILYRRTGSDIQYEAVEEMYQQIRSGQFRLVKTAYLQYLIENQKVPDTPGHHYYYNLSQKQLNPEPEKTVETAQTTQPTKITSKKDSDEESYDSEEIEKEEQSPQRRQTTVELVP